MIIKDLDKLFGENFDPNIIRLILVLLFSLISLFVPIVIQIIFPSIKKKLNPHSQIYLYAFTTGFFIILATFGFMHESIESATAGVTYFFTTDQLDQKPILNYAIVVPIVTGGVICGLALAYLIKFIFVKKFTKIVAKDKNAKVFIHSHHDEMNNTNHIHEHPDYIFNKTDKFEQVGSAVLEKTTGKVKLVALILLLTHRVFAGILIGWSINQVITSDAGSNSLGWAFIISFWLHLIPEELVFYYRLREAGYSSKKSLTYSILGLLMLIPFMLIGVYGATLINKIELIKGFAFALISGIFLFNALIEFLPEFYHVNMEKRRWHITIFMLLAGIVFAVFVLSFHSH